VISAARSGRTIESLVLAAGLAACASSAPATMALRPRHDGVPVWVVADGISVEYRDHGPFSPFAVVFVHGWTCDQRSWDDQLPALRRRVRAITLDLPGHGSSAKPQVDYTMDRFAEAIDAVLRDAGVERAVLVGHSMGAPVARQFLRRHPEKVAGIVVVDGMLVNLIPPAQREAFVARFDAPIPEEAERAMIATFFDDATPRQRRETLTATMLATPHHVKKSAMHGMFDPAVWTEEPIQVPTLVVMAKSPFWNEAYESKVRSVAPGVDYRVMDGVSHFLMVDRPAEFNAMLLEFVERQWVAETAKPASGRS
jgi:pimeloyl-ACP methyl ester carboxylesterase